MRSLRKGLRIQSTNFTVTMPPLMQPGNQQLKNIHKESEIVRKLVYKNNRKPPKMKRISPTKNNETMIIFGSPTVVHPKQSKHGSMTSPQLMTPLKPRVFGNKGHRTSTNRLHQLEEFETMLQSMEVQETAKKLISTRKPELRRVDVKKRRKTTQHPIIRPLGVYPQTNQKGVIPRFHAVKQHQSFALPPTVNLAKMHILDARPTLRKSQKQSAAKNLNILGRPAITATTVMKRKTFAAGSTHRPRIQSIQTQTDFDKPIMKSFKIEEDLVPFKSLSPEAFVSNDGTWTLEPATTTSATHSSVAAEGFPDYEATTPPPSTTSPATIVTAGKRIISNRRLLGDTQKVIAPMPHESITPKLVVSKYFLNLCFEN